jgi:spore maturation protein CgeB
MKPRILLATKVPFQLQSFISGKQKLPYFQVQSFWLKALQQLGYQTALFRYSDGFLCPAKIIAAIHTIVSSRFPQLFNRYRLLKNRGYRFLPGNYLRSFKLLFLIKSFQPQAIIISGGISELTAFPFIYAKKQKITLYLLHGENPLISATCFERNNLTLFDWIIVNDPTHAAAWKKLGANQVLALPYSGIDINFHRRLKPNASQPKKYVADVVFVGSLLPERQQILAQLTDYNLAVYGFIPPEAGLLKKLQPFYQGEAWGEKVVKIYNHAKIVLNFNPPHMPVGGNLRTFEIPACGAFQLADRCPEDWLIPSKEIELFNNLKQLKQKIAYYLAQPQKRNRIAQAGYHRVRSQCQYQHRLQTILALK